jgi:hypothetical protein
MNPVNARRSAVDDAQDREDHHQDEQDHPAAKQRGKGRASCRVGETFWKLGQLPVGVVRQFQRSECPRQESDLRTRFRKPVLYPLSYGGHEGQVGASGSECIGVLSGSIDCFSR